MIYLTFDNPFSKQISKKSHTQQNFTRPFFMFHFVKKVQDLLIMEGYDGVNWR
jgi:hypothetical protein